ncbi:MAG: (d)CMP kinase [Desulfocapsa sp.]|nr:(d)CMP kinase [Desulfocapsa sp.]
MSNLQKVVTIDGPSGVGKSTISRRVAANLSFTYLDTGAMYRAVALHLKETAVDLDDEASLRTSLDTLSLKLLPAAGESDDVGVILNGRDVSQDIRSPEMSMLASKVSALSPVREKLTHMQQEIGREGNIVAEGRDTGTVVFPLASWKFYLDADPKERMRRRAEQLREKGEQVDEGELLQMIIKRDHDDQARTIAPLCKAEDALLVDTGMLTINEVTEVLLRVIKEKNSALSG